MTHASPRRTEQTEIERKYDVHETAVVPDLADVRGGAASGPADDALGHLVVDRVRHEAPVELAATYWDTVEHTLLGARTTLRRREGGGDAGWHLKLPPSAGTTGRREVHWPLGRSDEPVPTALRHLVEARLRGRPVHPVLRLETTRTVTRLLDGSGRELAELADDVVRASNPDTGVLRTWREWEVELAPGVGGAEGEQLLDAVAERLESAGASVSSSKSKLARGLGGGPAAGGVGERVGGGSVAGEGTPAPVPAPAGKSAAAFVTGTVARLRDDLLVVDGLVRDDEPDAVHRLRTTIRRLRAVLRVWHGVLDPALAETVAAAAARAGRSCGAARDVEVARGRVATRASSAPSGLVTGQVTGRLGASLAERLGERTGDVHRLLDSPAWFDLLDALDALVDAPATGSHADDDAAALATRRLTAERRRAAKAARRALDVVARVRPSDAGLGVDLGDDDLATLRRTRKAARRLRHALEADRARSGSGRGRARRAEAVQDALGEHRDALASVAVLRDVAALAHRAGEDTFGYGVLATLEVSRAEHALRGFRRAARRL